MEPSQLSQEYASVRTVMSLFVIKACRDNRSLNIAANKYASSAEQL